MLVFISWSGQKSRNVAVLISEWLECVIQASKPWLSTRDIDRGSLWFAEIGEQLNDCELGVVCLTRENKDKPWILFECGALAKGLSRNRVCPLLIDLNSSDLEDPLAQFNCTLPNRDGMWKLVQTLNSRLGDRALKDSALANAFKQYWPEFETKFELILSETHEVKTSEARSPEGYLEEILNTSRRIERMIVPSIHSSGLREPENDVQNFYLERIVPHEGSSLTMTDLYEDYCEWCDRHEREQLALPTFGREFSEIGVQKAKIQGRVRYIGIALNF